MQETLTPIIQASELLALYKTENLVIVDAGNGIDAKSNYTKNHLKGALFVDLNTQLSHIKADVSDGGRHPLPGFGQFSNTLTALGISSNSHVVIYDDKKGSNAAARFWWMLKSVGHKKVQVLNGGVQEAERINFPMSSKIENIRKSKPYKIENWKLPLAQIEEVEKVSKDDNYKVIDVREVARYNGTFEPIDLIAGHIPGAINIPFSENLDKNGLFLSANQLKEKYQGIFGNLKSDHIIFHCGSGVTACHSLLAVAYSGLEIPKLYVGSWSEWSRNNKTIKRT